MNLLLVSDQDDPTREKLAFSIEGRTGLSVTQASTIAEAVRVLEKKAFSCIVLDVPAAAEADLMSLQKTVRLPMIWVVTGRKPAAPPADSGVVALVQRADAIEGVLSALNREIQSGVIQVADLERSDFCRIHAPLLLSICPLRGDVYIRLSDSHFVKLFKSGDVFEPSDLEKYMKKKGVNHFYIRTSDTGEFIQKYQADLESQLERFPPLSLEEVARSNSSGIDTLRELGTRLGFTDEVQTLCKTQLRLTVRAMGRSPTLHMVLQRIDSFKGEYLAAHSTLVGYLACAIASQLEWGSEQTFQKLVLAGMLHDITLPSNELARARTLFDVESGKFTMSEREAYKHHPVAAAEIARGMSEVPPDVDGIILQHHELPDGTGFPRGLTHAYISPLSATFAVAHDLADALIADRSTSVPNLLAELAKRYPASRYRKILTAIRQVLADRPNG